MTGQISTPPTPQNRQPMETFLEISKYTLPSIVVFATAYFLLKEYLDDKQRGNQFLKKLEAQKITLPLRLQAYERFALFCDRVALPNLLLRIQSPSMTVRDLHAALLVSIRQEFEHNVAQQIYISTTLWQIISLAVDETLSLVTRSAADLEPTANAEQLVDALFANLQTQGSPTPLEKALSAIRTETASSF
jgi:hypothetical protein